MRLYRAKVGDDGAVTTVPEHIHRRNRQIITAAKHNDAHLTRNGHTMRVLFFSNILFAGLARNIRALRAEARQPGQPPAFAALESGRTLHPA